MANEIIAEYVHWRDTCDGKQFIIMWSDHTWETIRCRLQITGLVKNLTSSTWN